MLNYLGMEFLQNLLSYYVPRYKLALEHGYTDPSNPYYWVFEELRDRILAIRHTEKFLFALPLFMQQGNEEKSLQYVVSYMSKICGEFTALVSGGVQEASPTGHENNPYWKQANDVWDLMQGNYDMNNLPALYMDLCEYLIRALRFYLHMREQYFPVDKGKFDKIMRLDNSLVVDE